MPKHYLAFKTKEIMNYEEIKSLELNAAQARLYEIFQALAKLEAVDANYYSLANSSASQPAQADIYSQPNQPQPEISENNVANFAAHQARQTVAEVYNTKENVFPTPDWYNQDKAA